MCGFIKKKCCRLDNYSCQYKSKTLDIIPSMGYDDSNKKKVH